MCYLASPRALPSQVNQDLQRGGLGAAGCSPECGIVCRKRAWGTVRDRLPQAWGGAGTQGQPGSCRRHGQDLWGAGTGHRETRGGGPGLCPPQPHQGRFPLAGRAPQGQLGALPASPSPAVRHSRSSAVIIQRCPRLEHWI